MHNNVLAQRFKPRAGYVLESIDDELLLYHPVTEVIVYCNTTAATVWQLCDGRRTVGDMVQLLTQCYPEAATVMPEQVGQTVSELHSKGLLELVEDAAMQTPAPAPAVPTAFTPDDAMAR